MKKIIIATSILLTLTACGSKTVYVTDTEVPNSPEKTTTVVKTTDAPIATPAPEPVYTEEDEFIYDIESNYSGTIYVGRDQMIETGRVVCQSLLDGMSGQEVVWAIENAGGDLEFVQLVALSAVANFCPSQAYKFNGL
jgi:predicted small lipoprotein YifL